MFDFCLSVPDQVVAFSMDTTDPMHHKLPARPLIKYDIALSQLPLRGTKKMLSRPWIRNGAMLLPEITIRTSFPCSTSSLSIPT